MELKGRLRLIAGKVPKCRVVCDIGTDHAYIPVYLAERDICVKAVATDIKKGPLKLAEENIDRYGLSDIIETRLCDGLQEIRQDESDVIVIAGMGGLLISRILEDSIDIADTADLLVLQPMNAVEVLREWLFNNSFEITDEELAKEDNRIYVVITAKKSIKKYDYKEIDLYIGKKLVEKNDPLVSELVKKQLEHTNKVLEQIKNTDDLDRTNREKFVDLNHELNELYKDINR
ncbi:MAG: class I SAM-dependent methyltransferase [Bacillota bacterium]|nr:class I SAM-dependent methyltransferase [Bacillota bacterium]